MTVTVERVDETDPAALWMHHEDQDAPQPCFVQLDLAAGVLSAVTNELTYGYVPPEVRQRVWLWWSLPLVTALAANRVLERVLPFIEREYRLISANRLALSDRATVDSGREVPVPVPARRPESCELRPGDVYEVMQARVTVPVTTARVAELCRARYPNARVTIPAAAKLLEILVGRGPVRGWNGAKDRDELIELGV